jgi:hypothetical protein
MVELLVIAAGGRIGDQMKALPPTSPKTAHRAVGHPAIGNVIADPTGGGKNRANMPVFAIECPQSLQRLTKADRYV